MKNYGCYRSICATVLAAGLMACANNAEVTDRLLPSYASPFLTAQGLSTWTVRCPLQSITGLNDRDTSMFYKSNGMTKSLTEFCDEYDSSSRIPGGREEN